MPGASPLWRRRGDLTEGMEQKKVEPNFIVEGGIEYLPTRWRETDLLPDDAENAGGQ